MNKIWRDSSANFLNSVIKCICQSYRFSNIKLLESEIYNIICIVCCCWIAQYGFTLLNRCVTTSKSNNYNHSEARMSLFACARVCVSLRTLQKSISKFCGLSTFYNPWYPCTVLRWRAKKKYARCFSPLSFTVCACVLVSNVSYRLFRL